MSTGSKDSALRPSLEDLSTFCQVYEHLATAPESSLQTIAATIGSHKSALSTCLSRLEEVYDKPLITRKKSRTNSLALTPAARTLYWNADALRDHHQRVKECLQAEGDQTEVCVATTHGIMLHLMTGAFAGFLRTREGQAKIRFREYDYRSILEGVKKGEITLGVGPVLPQELHQAYGKTVRFETLLEQIDIVLVCHPSHALAEKSSGGKLPAPVLDSLGIVRLFVPPDSIHPGLVTKLPAPRGVGERIEVSSVSSILELVENEAGVGLVPGYYWILEESAMRGRLAYAPLPGLGQMGVAAYVSRTAERDLPEVAQSLLSAFRNHLGTLRFVPPPQPTQRRPTCPLSASLPRYTHQYYVSCHPEEGPACKWYPGEIYFTLEGGQNVSGAQTDLRGGKVFRRYSLWGRVDEDGLILHAKREGESGESYFASFVAAGDVLLGIWNGRDDYHSRIWAPMVLSILPLTPSQLKQGLANIQAKFPTYIDAASLPSDT